MVIISIISYNRISLHKLYLYVVEHHEAGERGKGPIIQHAWQDDVLNVAHAVGLVDFGLYGGITNWNHLLEDHHVPQKVAVLLGLG